MLLPDFDEDRGMLLPDADDKDLVTELLLCLLLLSFTVVEF